MIAIDENVAIARPVDRVFAFVTDLQNNPLWQTGVILSEKTSEGPLGEGATYRLVNRFMGKRLDSAGIISEYVPNRICSYRFVSGSVDGESSFIFEPAAGGTRFITRGVITLKLLQSVEFLAKRRARRQVKNDLLKLKELLENGGGQ